MTTYSRLNLPGARTETPSYSAGTPGLKAVILSGISRQQRRAADARPRSKSATDGDQVASRGQPTSGAAKIKGIDVTEQPLETKRFIAYIPEQVMLYKNLSGLENLEYFSALAGHEEYSREQLPEFFVQVGLEREVADGRVGAYSKGMRQKVGIAIVLAKQAEALLFSVAESMDLRR